METDSDIDLDLTPPNIIEAAKVTTLNLLPETSKSMYQRAYNLFLEWKVDQKTKSFSENVLMAYFGDLAKKFKSSTLWSHFSMLRTTLSIYNDIDIAKYLKLKAFLKRQSSGYKPKKSKIFTANDIDNFIEQAPDEIYLATKQTGANPRNLATVIRRMAHILQDFKAGPLDAYRKKASFDWKRLKIFLETEAVVRYQNEIYDAIQNHPDYSNNKYEFQTFDELRRLATRQALAQKSIDQLSVLHAIQDLKRPAASIRIMMQVSPASTIKYVVGDRLFCSSIVNMGSKRHQKYLSASEEGKILGCYCLTEIGHGSNARGMRTTATYDKQKKVFVLNSPDFEAAKCWAGGLGQAATHGTVYAQLILDGTSYGLHAFVVPIRNPRTMLPYPGLKVGDMGEKIGLNGVDNGFVMFENYEIPRENLLNKVGDVTEDGRYVTPIKDPNKRHGAALGSLSAGRVSIACICETLGIKALTIAIRYAAVRKQFGPDDKEVPILEYQSHQYRLLPYLAAAYVIKIFNTFLSETYMQFTIDALTGNTKEDAPELGMEIHGISSASKPMAGWIMKEAIQECRETCGGHGYLKVAGIGDVRNDHDANLTYEGENHVLIQQTANYLLKLWPLVLESRTVSSPMQSIDFLTNGLDILSKSRFTANTVDELCCPHYILKVYQWLVTYLLKSTYDKVNNEVKTGKPLFWAKNDSQVFYAKTLGIAYIQHFYLKRTLCTISECQDVAIKNVLLKLYALFALWSLEKHMPTLYKGEFIVGPRAPALIQDAILKLCAELKNDAVSLIDAVAPPDFIVNSVLGSSDGMVYKRLEAAITSSEYSMNRPKWWHEITNFDLKNKL